jgi:hypothetical protein
MEIYVHTAKTNFSSLLYILTFFAWISPKCLWEGAERSTSINKIVPRQQMPPTKTSNHPKESRNWCQITKSCKSCFRTFRLSIKTRLPKIKDNNLSLFERWMGGRTRNASFGNCLKSRDKSMRRFWVSIWSRNDRNVTRLNNFWRKGSMLQCKLIVFDD